MPDTSKTAVLVVGGGVAGMQASLDLATSGVKVYLVDRTAAIGGLMLQLDTTFPTDDCQMCMIAPRQEEGTGCLRGGVAIGRHPLIDILPLTDVESLEGEAGNFQAVLATRPRYIDQEKCTGCGDCAQVCPVNAIDAYNAGLSQRRAAYIPAPQAVPRVYAIDRELCNGCSLCAGVCKAGAVHYSDTPKRRQVSVGAVILAPGSTLFDPAHLLQYAYHRHPNVITSLEFERLLSGTGPQQGRLQRPSDGQEPGKIAWLQCIGSRDIKTHSYCSSICCMYALKEAVMAKKRATGPLDTAIFFMDMRTFGKDYELYYNRARDVHGVRCIRYRVPEVSPAGQDIRITYRDAAGAKQVEDFNLVVLSVGFQVGQEALELAQRLHLDLNQHNYPATSPWTPVATSRPGIFVCGAFQAPKDIPHSVMDAAAAAASCRALISTTPVRPGLPAAAAAAPTPVTGEPRIGVFVCECGDHLDKSLDTGAVRDYAATLPHVVHAESHPLPCLSAGQSRIQEAIAAKRLNRVVVAGCSPLTHLAVFQTALQQAGLNKYLVEMANIRNQDAWVHPGDRQAATAKAQVQVRQAVARAATLKPLPETAIPMQPRALVVGGGVAGLSAALNLAGQGFGVALVDKAKELGGLARRLLHTIEGLDVQAYLQDLIGQVQAHPGIEVCLETTIVGHSGQQGNFVTTVTVGPQQQERRLEHGAVILATGAREHRPTEFHYGQHEGVMSQLELGEFLQAHPEAAAAWQRVIMIQCVGSRNEANPNCSRVCCQSAVKHARQLKTLAPHLDVIILYRDMRMYGFLEDYYLAARDQGVLLVRYDRVQPPVVDSRDGILNVTFVDNVLARPIRLPVDAVVLSAGMEAADTTALARLFKAPQDSFGFFQAAHAKMRPLESPREGIYHCGTGSGPALLGEAITQGLAAAAGAGVLLSQTAQLLSPLVCRVDPSGCAACLACVRACPYGVPQINAEHRSEIDPARCRGCGICAAVCPAHTIHQAHYDDEQLMAEVRALQSA